MCDNMISVEDTPNFHYDFSLDEAKSLVRLLRQNHENKEDDDLNNLYIKLQTYFFNTMTIDEAEEFFL